MASVTRRSRAKGESRESADCRFAYVSGVAGVVFAARVRRVRSWSLCCWTADSEGSVEARAVFEDTLVLSCEERAVQVECILWYSAHVPQANSSSSV